MKTSTLLAALTLSAALGGNALAQEMTFEYPQPISSQKTRAEVQAEAATRSLSSRSNSSPKLTPVIRRVARK